MRIAVIGGSAAGLLASLLLARAGHEVVVLDRDPVQPALDAESARAWDNGPMDQQARGARRATTPVCPGR